MGSQRAEVPFTFDYEFKRPRSERLLTVDSIKFFDHLVG